MTTITTDRLILRPLAAGDADMIVCGLNNFAVSRWLGRVPYPYGTGDAEWFLNDTRRAVSGITRFAITHEGVLIGIIGVEEGEMGYWLAEPFWGRGFGREAARAVTDHAFSVELCENITAGYFIGNEGSRRILEGLGFAETKRDAKVSRAQNTAVPHVSLGLTRAAWQSARERR
jgi:RimJ/RimL family protein N-acetyltransferase